MGLRIAKQLSSTLSDGCHCKVLAIGRDSYEVRDGFTRFAVNLVEMTCECRI